MDLAAIAHDVRREEAYGRDGHAARTLVRAHDLRVVLIAIKPGARLPEHATTSTSALQVLNGRLQLRLPRRPREHEDRFEELVPGGLLVLDGGLAHSVEALEESTVLVTLGWRDKSA